MTAKKNIFSTRVREMRKNAGYSAVDKALPAIRERLGEGYTISSSWLYSIERGNERPKPHHILALAAAYHVDPMELAGDEYESEVAPLLAPAGPFRGPVTPNER